MKKLVFIGGGSNSWTPKIVKDMLLTDEIGETEYVLYDIDLRAAQRVARFLEKLNTTLTKPARFTATDQRDAAFAGADYFVITISTGGLDAMAHDIAIPEAYGIYHTVGDTSGPGGWARFIRNFGVFKELGETINRQAPGAMILNYTNPMTTLTQVLCRICKGPVVGLCHGLFENLTFLKQYYKVESEDEISVSYAGLNHFFWITEAKVKSLDVIADLNERLLTQTLTDLMRESAPDPMGFKSNRALATELFRLTGVMPYLGDRHTCEFFPQYISNLKNIEKYKLTRTTIKERHTAFDRRITHLDKMIACEVDAEYLQRSRETAADIIAAHSQGKPFIDVGNLPNIGQIANLPMGSVVETAMRVDQNGFTPLAFGPLPEPIAGFVQPFATAFNLVVDACFEGDRRKALHALRLDPVCSHLNGDEVNQMGEQLLKTHQPFVDMF